MKNLVYTVRKADLRMATKSIYLTVIQEEANYIFIAIDSQTFFAVFWNGLKDPSHRLAATFFNAPPKRVKRRVTSFDETHIGKEPPAATTEAAGIFMRLARFPLGLDRTISGDFRVDVSTDEPDALFNVPLTLAHNGIESH